MEQALRNRLTFGPLMMGALLGLLWLDHAAEGWTAGHGTRTVDGVYGVGGIGLLVLLIIILPPAVVELTQLFAAERVQPYRFIAAAGSAALAIHAFLTQFNWFKPIAASTLAFAIVFVMLAAALARAMVRQTQEAIVHMAGTL